MYLRRIFFSIGLIISSLACLKAQFENPGSDAARLVFRDFGNPVDSTFIYVFYTPQLGALKAVSVDGTAADFNWFKFDLLANKLDDQPFHTEQGVTVSQVKSLLEGGYMVEILQENEGDIQRDTFYSWVFLDTLEIKSIDLVANTCDYLSMRVVTDMRLRYYYTDFSKSSEEPKKNQFIFNNYTIRWTSSQDIRDGIEGLKDDWQGPNSKLLLEIRDPAPLVESKYTAEIENEFGNKNIFTSKSVPAVAVYAKMEMLRPDEANVFVPSEDFSGEALFRLKLKNDSRNADVFEWKGKGNQNINIEANRVLWTSTDRDVMEELTYKPGKFPIELEVKSSKAPYCTSASQTQNKVINLDVLSSKFDPNSIPNVFSPNGDGRNDLFHFVQSQRPVSIKNIDVQIFGRNGNRIYSYSGDIHQWQGWNGKLNGSGAECASGVYYYILKAEGWDDVGYSGKQYTGSLHLFRGN